MIKLVWYVFRVSGCDLLTRVVQLDHYSELQCISWLRQICQGVDHMHKNNIIHLDLRVSGLHSAIISSPIDRVPPFRFFTHHFRDPKRPLLILFCLINRENNVSGGRAVLFTTARCDYLEK